MAEVADEIDKSSAKRLGVDALNSFAHTTFKKEDSLHIVAKRLASLMRETGVTSIFSMLSTPDLEVALKDLGGLSWLFNSIVVLRHTEVGENEEGTDNPKDALNGT